MTRLWLLVLLAGCRQVLGLHDLPDLPDAAPDVGIPGDGVAARPVPHLPPPSWFVGVADLIASGTIDTSSATSVPQDLAPEIVAQDPSGPELFVIHANHVTIAAGQQLAIVGGRPLVIVAQTIEIDGTLDAGAHGVVTGPGAVAADPGQSGNHVGIGDGGGGGGGFGKGGGHGGTASTGCSNQSMVADGGAPGPLRGNPPLTVLVGGTAGGPGGSGMCSTTAQGGGGGGAVQLTAFQSVTIAATGRVLVGGGGGAGGATGCQNSDFQGGAGGGAGGAIVIDALDFTNAGTIAANGGGGGGASCSTSPNPGSAGADALGTNGASGGPGAGCGTAGGAGGSETLVAGSGAVAMCTYNAGGGGGGVGRIVYDVFGIVDDQGTVSPLPVRL